MVDNPKKVLAPGWNNAITHSTGDIIIRVDAHAEIPPEFVENNVRHHEEGEMVTGGARPNIIDGSTPFKQTLLMAESSVFGSSAADFRRNGKKRYVRSIFHGAYRREVFEKVGLFKLRQPANDLPVLRLCLFRDGFCGSCIIAQHSGQLLLKGA